MSEQPADDNNGEENREVGAENERDDLSINANCSSNRKLSFYSTFFSKPPIPENTRNFNYCTEEIFESHNLEELILEARGRQEQLTTEFSQILLLQITNALHLLHEHGKAHGSLDASVVYFVKNKKYIILGEQHDDSINGTSYEFSQDSVKRDMVFNANLHCFVLTNGVHEVFSEQVTSSDLKCLDSEIALDLMRKMSGNYDTKQALKHPFYWTVKNKIVYLNESCETTRCKDIKDAKKVFKNDSSARVIPLGGWIKKLDLTKQDMSRLKRRKIRGPVKIQIIADLTKPKKNTNRKIKFENTCIFDLLRFFRNHYVHMNENEEPVKECFEKSDAGYWNFFSTRFPKLFMHIYTIMISYKKFNVEEITYNKPLPDSPFE
uniref:uncharacterized protein LOC120329209 n=1 Tax=Styela clava TaxID=7725 RepID=UPI001939F98D|nr:uncharacterized protein LOC120329209 [Styela clava]